MGKSEREGNVREVEGERPREEEEDRKIGR